MRWRILPGGLLQLVYLGFEMQHLSVQELLAQYRAILAELRDRGVVRTNNAPTGDYAEWLTAQLVAGELAPNSEKSFDVSAPDGRTLQVKARISSPGAPAGTRQLSAFRSWGFDEAVIVLFNDDYTISRATVLDVDRIRESAAFVAHTNSYRVNATDEFLDGGQDITMELRRIAGE